MSDVEERLRYMRIYDEEVLEELEHDFAGAIKLGLAGRYGCRMLAKGNLFEFTLGRMPNGEEDFFVTRNGLPIDEETLHGRLYRLARHRAAEVIGAVRAGHTEYNARRPQRRKTA